MAVTLERLLTHPRAFGLVTASPVQRAVCRVADGLPLGELACDESVVRSFGGPDAIARLPTKPPKELYLVGAIRGGKSMLSSAMGFRAAQTVPLERLMGPQEIARVSIVSLDRDKAAVVKQHLMGALTHDQSALRRYLVRETADRVLVSRDDGRLVEIVIAAGRVGGGSLVSRWTIAVVFDEAARMLGKADGVINFDDMRAGVIARVGLVPGGQLFAVTSPWVAHGPIYDAVQEHFGKPTEHLVVVRANGPDLNPRIWTPEACEAERQRPNGSYETDVLGDFVDPEAGFLTAGELRSATRASPIELPRDPAGEYTAAMDPATSGNAWTLVIAGRWGGDTDVSDRFRIALARQWQGTPGQPLKAREVFGEMAPILQRYGIGTVYTDRWGGSLLAEHGDYAGISVEMAKDTAEEVARRHADFRTLVLDGRLEIAPVPQLVGDLLSTRKRRLPGGGVKYEYPLTRDGRHADFAPAAVLAIARACGGPSWVSAMARWKAGGGVL